MELSIEPPSKPNANASNQDFEFAALDRAKNYRTTIIQEFQPYLKGTVWEIGAGIGQITQSLMDLPNISELICIEPELKFTNIHRQRNHHPNLTLIEGTIDNAQSYNPPKSIISVNVLEHIEKDTEELQKYHTHLSHKNGDLCLLVPARDELYSAIDKDFGHFRRYKKHELSKKLQNAGFALKKIHYFNSAGYFAWLIKFKLLRSRTFAPNQVTLYDSYIFPPVHWLETHICRPPIGQSLIAVATANTNQNNQ
jgi:precorrin-6B methylase 2